MRIAIVELYQHSEVAFGWTRLASLAGFEVWLFGKQEWLQWKDFSEDEQVQIHAMIPGEHIPSYLEKIQSKVKACDLILIPTMVSHFKAFAQWNPGPPKVLLIHSLNTFLNPIDYSQFKVDIPFTFPCENLLRLGKASLYQTTKTKRAALASMTALTTPSIELESQLKSYPSNSLYKWISPIPWVWPEFQSEPKASPQLHLVIPGTVRPEGRNFDPLIKAIEGLPKNYTRTWKITLAGKVEGRFGKEILNRLQHAIRDRGILIYALNGYSQMQYEQILQDADFFLLPLKPNLHLGLYTERYGQTNISGGVSDAIRFQKPILIPDWYTFPIYWKHLAIPYSNAFDLMEQLLTVHASPIPKINLKDHEQVAVQVFRRRVGEMMSNFSR